MLAAAAILLAIRWRGGITPVPLWLTRITLLTAICGSVAAWFRFLLPTIGGADSYGYVSASELIARGSLIADAPVAEWLSTPNRMAIVSPLGWAPAPDGSGIVPTYPLGLPVLMALVHRHRRFRCRVLRGAMCGCDHAGARLPARIVVVRRRYGAACHCLVAWNPLFIAYAKQPMSDVPAAMWMVLALCLAIRSTPATAFGAGLAAGAAVDHAAGTIARRRSHSPGRLPGRHAATACRDERRRVGDWPWRADGDSALLVRFAVLDGLRRCGGAAFRSVTSRRTSVIFAKHGWLVVGPLWILGLIIGLFASRPEPRSKPAMIFCAVLIPYLFYLPFDHWETLRYLLPGIVPLTVTVADGLMHFARTPRHQVATAVILCAFIAVAVVQSELLLRRSSAWDIAAMEARYPLAGEWVNVNTPPNSVVLANQHSGSLRWYGKRQTLRWDFIAPEDLATIVGEIESHGAAVYVALEGAEVEMFDVTLRRRDRSTTGRSRRPRPKRALQKVTSQIVIQIDKLPI